MIFSPFLVSPDSAVYFVWTGTFYKVYAEIFIHFYSCLLWRRDVPVAPVYIHVDSKGFKNWPSLPMDISKKTAVGRAEG